VRGIKQQPPAPAREETGGAPTLHPAAAFAAGAAAGAAAAALLARKILSQHSRRCLEERREAENRALQAAAEKLNQLADLLRRHGCYDLEPRLRIEAEAMARHVRPEEVAYYRCLIQCLRGACRVEECMKELGFTPQDRQR